MNQRSRNLGLLARRFQPFRKKAVFALEFGLDILVAGMKNRAPRGKTGRLARSIKRTKIINDHKRHRLYGRAVVTAPYALYVEYPTSHNRAQPFVRPTQMIDGPAAVAAVASILRS
jgi:hypothetical protein